MLKMSVESRFWGKVNKTDTCWIWNAQRNSKGYGWFDYKGKGIKAHRMVWILTHGEIPKGLCVLHHCDNPSCVNPDHLFLGTYKDNSEDMIKKGRSKLCGNHKGGNHHKLNGIDIIRIRTLLNQGAKMKDLSVEYHICYSHISRIKSGRCWKDLVCPVN